MKIILGIFEVLSFWLLPFIDGETGVGTACSLQKFKFSDLENQQK